MKLVEELIIFVAKILIFIGDLTIIIASIPLIIIKAVLFIFRTFKRKALRFSYKRKIVEKEIYSAGGGPRLSFSLPKIKLPQINFPKLNFKHKKRGRKRLPLRIPFLIKFKYLFVGTIFSFIFFSSHQLPGLFSRIYQIQRHLQIKK